MKDKTAKAFAFAEVRRSWWGGIANRSKWLMVTYPKGDITHSKSKQRRPGREKRSIDCDGEERTDKMLKARNSFGPYECSREAIDRWRVHLRLDPSCFHSSINLPDNMGPSRKSVTKTSTKNKGYLLQSPSMKDRKKPFVWFRLEGYYPPYWCSWAILCSWFNWVTDSSVGLPLF